MRIRAELFLATLALVSFVTFGYGDPFGYGHVGTRNKACSAVIASKMLKRKNDPSSTIHFKFAGQPVSGTNVEFTIGASVAERPLPIPEGEPPLGDESLFWNRTIVQSVELKVNGESVALPAVPANTDSWGAQVCIDSTHFAHDGPITLLFIGHFRLERYNESGTTLLEFEEVEVPITVPLKAYNVGLPLATKEKWVPASYPPPPQPPIPAHYETDPNSSEAQVALATIAVAIPGMIALNHNANPATAPGAQSLDKPALLGLVTNGTHFVAVTHSDGAGGIRPSYGGNSDLVTWNEIAAKCALKGTPDDGQAFRPAYNLAILVSCSALSGTGSDQAPRAFEIYDPSGASYSLYREDCALIGFPVAVSAGENITKLPEWTTLLYSLLSSGYSVVDALFEIKLKKLFLIGTNGKEITPQLRGDPATKLHGAYRLPSQDKTWIKVWQ